MQLQRGGVSRTQSASTASGRITATDIDMANCLDAQGWVEELNKMKPAGYDELNAILNAADSAGFNVYIGPLEDEAGSWDFWYDNVNHLTNYNDAISWHEQVANDIYTAYDYHTSFKGWLIRQEVDLNDIVNNGGTSGLGEISFYQTVAANLDTLKPTGGNPLPIMAPPFFKLIGIGTPPTSTQVGTAMGQMLTAVPQLDIIALQDGVGAGNVNVSDVSSYFAAAGTAIGGVWGVSMWGGVENFQTASGGTLIPTTTPLMFTDISDVDGTSQLSKVIQFIFHNYGSSSVAFPTDGMHNGDEQYASYMLSSNWAYGNTTYTYSTAPNASYPDSGHELTDGVLGGTSDMTPYVGWTGVGSVTITFDLGAVKEIKSILVHTISGTSWSMDFPTSRERKDGFNFPRLSAQTRRSASPAAVAPPNALPPTPHPRLGFIGRVG